MNDQDLKSGTRKPKLKSPRKKRSVTPKKFQESPPLPDQNQPNCCSKIFKCCFGNSNNSFMSSKKNIIQPVIQIQPIIQINNNNSCNVSNQSNFNSKMKKSVISMNNNQNLEFQTESANNKHASLRLSSTPNIALTKPWNNHIKQSSFQHNSFGNFENSEQRFLNLESNNNNHLLQDMMMGSYNNSGSGINIWKNSHIGT